MQMISHHDWGRKSFHAEYTFNRHSERRHIVHPQIVSCSHFAVFYVHFFLFLVLSFSSFLISFVSSSAVSIQLCCPAGGVMINVNSSDHLQKHKNTNKQKKRKSWSHIRLQ